MNTLRILFIVGITCSTHLLFGQFATTINSESPYDAGSIDEPINTSLAVGVTPGQAGVSQTGAANYSIPIQTPEGTGGIAPSLALAYSSQAGDGILGFGWNLTGLSNITRGSFVYATDGKVGRPELLKTDPYFLDGNRLIHATGTYGDGGSSYSTRVRDFSSINVDYGTSTGPLCFRVERNGGVTYEYGCVDGTTNSLWHHSSGTVMVWALDRISDCHGNYMEIEYFDDENDGVKQQLIKEIRYTGNQNAGLAPYNKVVFDYGMREDDNKVYTNGGNPFVQSLYLLKSITVFGADNMLFKTYNITYTQVEGRSTIKKIQECGAEGGCLNHTKFRVGEIASTYDQNNTNLGSGNYDRLFLRANLNNDGRDDLIRIKNPTFTTPGTIEWLKSDAGASLDFETMHTLNIPANGPAAISGPNDVAQHSIGDFDGNGLDDFVWVKVGNNTINYLGQYTSPPTITEVSFYKTLSGGIAAPQPYSFGLDVPTNFVTDNIPVGYVGDFDGDSKSDFFFIGNFWGTNQARMFLAGGEVLANITVNAPLAVWSHAKHIRIIDFDGDGDNEIMLVIDGSPTAFVFDVVVDINNSSVEFSLIHSDGFPTMWHEVYPGDFNGDRITDLLTCDQDHANWQLHFGTGNGYDLQPTPGIPSHAGIPAVKFQYRVADYNGDGFDDVILRRNNASSSPNASRLYVVRSLGAKLENGAGPWMSSPAYVGNCVPILSHVAVGDFNGDGRQDIANVNTGGGALQVIHIFKNGRERHLLDAVDGLGNKNSFEYKPLSHGSFTSSQDFYNTSATPNSYPFMDIHALGDVVKHADIQDALEGQIRNKYSYEGGIAHMTGFGFLGFEKVVQTSDATSLKTTRTGELHIPTVSLNLVSELVEDESSSLTTGTLSPGQEISETKYEYLNQIFDPSQVCFARFTNKRQTINYLDDSMNETTMTWTNLGDLEISVEKIGLPASSLGAGTPIKTIHHTNEGYYESCNGQSSGVPVTIYTVSTREGQDSWETQHCNYYDESLGRLTNTTRFCDQQDALSTDFENFDAFGNPQKITKSTFGEPSRINQVTFDPTGKWVISSTNALGQSPNSPTAYHPLWGKPIEVTDLDGLTAEYAYDEFGRLESSTDPLNNQTDIGYYWDVQSGSGSSVVDADNAKYYVQSEIPGSPLSKKYFDKHLQVRQQEVQNFEGGWNKTVTTYDKLGRVVNTTSPFSSISTIVNTANTYDDLGRLTHIQIDDIGLSENEWSYFPLHTIVTATDPNGEEVISRRDASGVVTAITDQGGTLLYIYDSQDNKASVDHNGSIVAAMEFDDLGRNTQLSDPSSGITTYSYNGYGELKSQSEVGGQIVHSMTYNLLGQLVTSTGPEGTTHYSYFTNPGQGMNKLKMKSGFNGDTKLYDYDSYNRLASLEYQNQNVKEEYVYDNFGRLTKRTVNQSMVFTYAYNNHGYMETVKAQASSESSPTTIFRGLEKDELDNFTQYIQSNGVTTARTFNDHGALEYTGAGNIFEYDFNWDMTTAKLTSRTDMVEGVSESFAYDALYRLEEVTMGGSMVLEMEYSNSGNIESKTDVGGYTYAGLYKQDMIVNPNQDIALHQQQISYTTFNEPYIISENDYEHEFEYNADKRRLKSSLKYQGQLQSERTYYPEMAYETYTNANTQMKYHLYYEQVDGQTVSMVVKEEDLNMSGGSGNFTSPNGEGYLSVYTDYLGSILKITDEDQNIVAHQSFDAWGRKRNATDWTFSVGFSNPEWLYRGFTFHEHLEVFDLVHMNGRMYAPLTGRMLGVDNLAHGAMGTQGFNRFAYAFNDPLSFNDPNGDIPILVPIIIGAALGAYTGGVMANDGDYNPGQWDYSSGRTWSYMIGGAIVGGAAGYMGASVAASGMPMANTAAIVTGSFSSSVGMTIVTGGRTPVSIGFGAGSYNITSNEFGYLGKSGNSTLENIGYGLGAIANISDGLAGFNTGEVELQTENIPRDGKPDIVGHAQLNRDGEVLIDFGPAGEWKRFEPGRNDWVNRTQINGRDKLVSDLYGQRWDPVAVRGVNINRIQQISDRLNQNPGTYQVATRSCSSVCSRALTMSGVPSIGLHPYILHSQMFLRSAGVRPTLYSYYAY